MPVTAKQLHAVLHKPNVLEMLAKQYKHIKPFSESELEDFLTGKEGAVVDDRMMPITRSYQVKQALSAVGAYMVDRGTADAQTAKIYKGVWDTNQTTPCKYCGKPVKSSIMFKRDVCNKSRCQLASFRDSV